MSEDTNTQAPEFVPVPNAEPQETTETTANAATGESDEVPATATAPPDAPPPDAPPLAPKARKPTKRTQATVTKTDPVTDVATTSDVIDQVELDELPATATLAAPYAFYDDDGALHSWAAGHVLVDADEIAMLMDRGALFTPE